MVKIIFLRIFFKFFKENFINHVNQHNFKSKKLPILENVVIRPIVIKTTINLTYTHVIKLSLIFFDFFRYSRLEIKQKSKKIENTVLLTKKPVEALEYYNF